MNKNIIISILIILILFSFTATSFCADIGIMPLSITTDDFTGIQQLLEGALINAGYISKAYLDKDLSKDDAHSFYFVYDDHRTDENAGFDVIIILTGQSSIVQGSNAFYIKDMNNQEQVVNKTSATSDWRSDVHIKYCHVSYKWQVDNYQNFSYSRTDGKGEHNINELFNITTANYSNLLFVSNNYLSRFKTIFPNFENHNIMEDVSTEFDWDNINNLQYMSYYPGDLLVNISGVLYVNSFDWVLYKNVGEEQEEVIRLKLNKNSNYWFEDDQIFNIPTLYLKSLCENGSSYTVKHEYFSSRFCYSVVDNNFTYTGDKFVIDSGVPPDNPTNPDNDKTNQIVGSITESNDKVINAINDQNETNKGIFETIKSIVNFLNPLSEDFFVYKLIALLLDMLKSLFIPSEDFFSNYIDELNQQFSDTFGILYYPVDLLIDFLNRVGCISESSSVIKIPQFDISFMGYQATIIQEFTFDFNSMLTNDTLKRLHDMYLVFVDILLWLGIVYLASDCVREILGGMSNTIPDFEDTEKYKELQTTKDYYRKMRVSNNHKNNMKNNK